MGDGCGGENGNTSLGLTLVLMLLELVEGVWHSLEIFSADVL